MPPRLTPRARIDPERLKRAIYGTILVVSPVAVLARPHVREPGRALYPERGRRPGLADVGLGLGGVLLSALLSLVIGTVIVFLED